mgnify:CR=1 FL=1
MKLQSASTRRLVFRLNDAERDWLVEVLSRYPVVPESHATLTRQGDASLREHEQLLRDSLTEQRHTLRARIKVWLAAPGRWLSAGRGHRLIVPREDGEWLLQVFNDVRVGSWLRLGAPEELTRDPGSLPVGQQMDFALMELSGVFQMVLLQALDEESGP